MLIASFQPSSNVGCFHMFWNSLEADPPQTASTWTANATLHADPTCGLWAHVLISYPDRRTASTDNNVIQYTMPVHPLPNFDACAL